MGNDPNGQDLRWSDSLQLRQILKNLTASGSLLTTFPTAEQQVLPGREIEAMYLCVCHSWHTQTQVSDWVNTGLKQTVKKWNLENETGNTMQFFLTT